MKRNAVYFDGVHKIKVFGIRSVSIPSQNKFLVARTKNFIQVKIYFLGQFYMWINIARRELLFLK